MPSKKIESGCQGEMDRIEQAGITAFELERNRKVQENMRRMQELGILKLASAVTACVTSRLSRPPSAPSPSPLLTIKSRASQSRGHGKENGKRKKPIRVTYSCEYFFCSPPRRRFSPATHRTSTPSDSPPIRPLTLSYRPPPKPVRPPPSRERRDSLPPSVSERNNVLVFV